MSNQDDLVASQPNRFFSAWLDASAELASGVLRANRALIQSGSPADGPSTTGDPNGDTTDEDAIASEGSTERVPAESEGVAFDEPTWEVSLDFANEDAVSVGDSIRFSKELDVDDVRTFATASGDTNRLHLDDEFAEDTRFAGTIVHGTLVSGLISAALARLPGVVIYLSQDTSFVGPVQPGQRATAVVEVLEDLGNRQYRLSTEVYGDDDLAVEGEAVVLIDDLPDSD